MEGAVLGVEADPDVAPPGLIRGALRDTWTSLRSVFGNPALRRIEAALATSMVGDWAYATAVVVWAYGVGGARLVGIWMAVRYVLMAIVSPIGASLADRLPRKAVLIGSDLIRALLATVAGIALFTDAPAAVILVVATVLSLIGCVFRPAQMAWMPSLTRRPEELTAANGASSTIESLAFFLGPALGALLVTDHQRAGRLPPQRRHLPAVRRARLGHPPDRRPDPRRRRATSDGGRRAEGGHARRDGRRVPAHRP